MGWEAPGVLARKDALAVAAWCLGSLRFRVLGFRVPRMRVLGFRVLSFIGLQGFRQFQGVLFRRVTRGPLYLGAMKGLSALTGIE